MDTVLLRVEGEVRTPCDFAFADLAALPGQIVDVGALIPGRHGGGVWLRSLLNTVGPLPRTTHMTLHATDGSFSASVPLEAVADRGIVVYRLGNGSLPAAQGGPVRFYITDVKSCVAGEVDACANVKFLGVMQLTKGAGVDTRPTTGQDHTALHQQKGHEHLS